MKKSRIIILTFLALAGVYGCGGSGGPSSPSPDSSTAGAPTLLTADPAEIPMGGGSQITVTGEHLQGAQVQINGTEATDVVYASGPPEALTFTAPAGETGPALINIRNNAGLSVESATLLTYQDVDPCAAGSNGDQLFPKDWIEEGDGHLSYDADRDWLFFSLGKKIFYRPGKEAWRSLATLPAPITQLTVAPGQNVLYVKMSGYNGDTQVFGLREIDLDTQIATSITPGVPDIIACQDSSLSFDAVQDALYLSCEDRIWRHSGGVWTSIAQNADAGGNLFVSVAAGTKADGTPLVCAGAKNPAAGNTTGEGVYCKEGNQPWALVPNATWHQHFDFFLKHLLLMEPQAAGLISLVAIQDPQVLEGHPGQDWTELMSLPSPRLPEDAVLAQGDDRLFVIDDACNLYREESGAVTNMGLLGGALASFDIIRCPASLALDESHSILYAPTYINACPETDGVCPKLFNIAAVCVSP
jgi:IPT/TIG domain-containing protein